MTPLDVKRMVDGALSRFRTMIERVSNVVFADDGITAKGMAGDDVGADWGGAYGFQSRPPDGGEGVIAKVEGRGANAVLLSYRHRRYELALEKGELVMVDDQGQKVHIQRALIALVAGASKIEINKDGDVNVVPKGGQKFNIGESGLQAIPVGDDLETRLQTIENAINNFQFNIALDATTPLTTTNAVVGAPCTVTAGVLKPHAPIISGPPSIKSTVGFVKK
ncbi:MAG TPA: hypothetical protein VKP14_10205 [Gaiellaceae bacterium]|nr:hypothetical protein [Gaiellaceae bacterium]